MEVEFIIYIFLQEKILAQIFTGKNTKFINTLLDKKKKAALPSLFYVSSITQIRKYVKEINMFFSCTDIIVKSLINNNKTSLGIYIFLSVIYHNKFEWIQELKGILTLKNQFCL